jgi:hypothetical protein
MTTISGGNFFPPVTRWSRFLSPLMHNIVYIPGHLYLQPLLSETVLNIWDTNVPWLTRLPIRALVHLSKHSVLSSPTHEQLTARSFS